jgi:hypothetical protein
MGETAPRPDARAQIRTRYVLEPGAVSRFDELTFDGSAVIDLEFPTFSRRPTVDGDVIRFAEGEVASFEVGGMACAPTSDFDPAVYAGAGGAFRTLVRCRAEATGRISLSWRIRFSR